MGCSPWSHSQTWLSDYTTITAFVTQLVKNPPVVRETWVLSLCWDDPLLLQNSGLENSMDYTAHGIPKSWTRLSHFHFYFSSFSHILDFIFYVFMLNVLILEWYFSINRYSLMVNYFVIYSKILDYELNFTGGSFIDCVKEVFLFNVLLCFCCHTRNFPGLIQIMGFNDKCPFELQTAWVSASGRKYSEEALSTQSLI